MREMVDRGTRWSWLVSCALCLLPRLVLAQQAITPAPDSATQPASAPAAEQPAPAVASPAPVVVSTRRAPLLDPLPLQAVSLALGAAVSVIAVPTALVGGSYVGALPPNLVAAMVPALAIALLIPPLAVAGSEAGLQVWLGDGAGSFWWAWGATTATHVVTLVAATLLGASTSNPLKLASLVAVEALLLPATATGTLWLTSPRAGDAP